VFQNGVLRNKFSHYSIGSAVLNVAFITGMDACEVKIPQDYKQNKRIYWLVLLQFGSVQIVCCFGVSNS
jgi:hypothetical protein